ncbi:hypothetical protein M2G39_19480 [Vibrio vulnificus]|nr:hypothetical protein [Vibrio vulnificus]
MLAFFSFLLLLGRDEDLIGFANSVIPKEWTELYGKKDYTDFYRDTRIAFFQLINFFMMLIFFSFSYKNKFNFDKEIKNLMLLTLFLQFLITTLQVLVLDQERPTGTLDNSQSVAFLLSIITCYLFMYASGWPKVFLFSLIVLTALLTGTRSVIAVLVLLYIFNMSFFRNKFALFTTISIALSSFLITMLLSSSKAIQEIVLFLVSTATSPLSLNVRFLMWSSFYEVVSRSVLFGTMGIPVYFTDNLFWNFILPYGIFGFIFVIFFFGSMIFSIKKNPIFYYFVIVYSVQAITYSGAFLSNLAMGLFLLLGYEYSKISATASQ